MDEPRTRRFAGVTGGVVVALVIAALAAGAGYLTTDAARSPAGDAGPAAPTVGGAYAAGTVSPHPVPSTQAPIPSASTVGSALASAVTATGLGARLRAEVVDAATGRTLYARAAAAPTAPASTAKLLTAAAILSVREPDDRFSTRVVAGPGTAVTVIGGGDPTLSAARPGTATTYGGAARIADLATALHRLRVRPTRIVVDDSLFTGPAVSPDWAAEDVPSDYASAVTALMVDGGRAAPADVIRSTTPDLDAGRALAVALGSPQLTVVRGTAPAGARTLATVRSETVGALVFDMLQTSDNVIAEVLGRQVALARRGTPSFTGAAAAIRAELTGLGVDPGAGMRDASGLAASDRLAPTVLAAVLRLTTRADLPRLHPVVAALPVAGWSGTLAGRYLSGSAGAGSGAVRAKTGTLTGVSTLAGVVPDRSGRLLVFALMADRTVSTPAADAALDVIAARLATCTCTG